MDLSYISGHHALSFMQSFDYIREAGSEAEKTAAEAILSHVEKLGLSAAKEPYTFTMDVVDEVSFTVTEPFQKTYRVSGYLGSSSTNGKVEAPFVYAENGDPISLRDVKGKIVLVNGPVRPELYMRLMESGAAAFLSVTGTPIDEGVDRIPANRELRFPSETTLPGGILHHLDVIDLVENGASRAVFSLKQHREEKTSQNIICQLPGTDPSLAHEILTITAHYDSVPAGKGAYDNLSGCAIVYELLTYFAAHPAKRPITFIWFGGEEKGLLGSRAYVKAHADEMPMHRLNLNIDLAGQLVGGTVYGVTAEKSVDELLLTLAEEAGFGAETKNQIWSSDSNSFAAAGVPAVTLDRDGFGMHTRHDTLEHISWWSLERDARMLGYAADYLANQDIFPIERTMPEEYLEKLNRRK